MSSNLNRRTVIYLENQGWKAQNVECYNSFSRRYSDLFGAFDVLAYHTEKQRFAFVQVTSKGNMSARRKKLLESEAAQDIFLFSFADVIIHGWFQQKKGGRWEVKKETLIPAMLTK